jgi:hypothetical protein
VDDPAETSEAPRARVEQRPPVQLFVIITARRAESDSVVTVEMSSNEWFDLPPVRQALQDELKRRKLSRRSLSRLAHGKGCSLAITPSTGVPGGHVERSIDELVAA